MTNLSDIREMKARITVFGVGGAGGNAVNNMIASGLEGVDFIVANTDAQALMMSNAKGLIHMGAEVTKGLGAGSQPEVGRAAAEETIDAIREHLDGTHMVFVTAGMGGGTGTGAAPVIAQAARELGILTIGVVTKPFQFEGQRRMRLAEAGIAELLKVVDTALIIPNQNLFRVAKEKTTFADAFALADQVLYAGVACISDLIVKEGLINLDFADVLTVMREKGKAMMGRGEASGEKRVLTAAVAAMSNPLIEDPSIKRASGLIISITGGKDMMLYEVDEAVSRIRDEADANANIIVGASFDDSMEGIVRVSVVATGIDNLDRASETHPAETSLTELAARIRNDSLRDDRLGHAPLAQVASPPLRPAEPRAPQPRVEAPPLRPRANEGRMARPVSDNARHVTPQGLATPQGTAAPHGLDAYRQPSVPHAVEDVILDIPAFLRRQASQ
jgi:cell division protein FtsZ